MVISTFRAGFASYHYPHFITLFKEGYTVINATVGMMTYWVEILQGECQGKVRWDSMEWEKKKTLTDQDR